MNKYEKFLIKEVKKKNTFILTIIIGSIWSPLYYVGFTLTLWCIYFFRNPSRITPILSGSNKNNLIISPADGTVIEISKRLHASKSKSNDFSPSLDNIKCAL